MSTETLFSTIEKQAQDGVDFMTLHCGITMQTAERMFKQGRVTGVVSRGGAFMLCWMQHHRKENPLYEEYDRILEIAKAYDVTISLGDALRPGCISDASDRAQVGELMILGELAQRAKDAGVQVMVEGPGHMPIDQIEYNVRLQKSLCNGTPFYVLGPLVTDVAPGYDHIVAAIGGALAAASGADFLCYVTPSEHVGLPSVQDVKQGVVAARIAAHAADIVKLGMRISSWDLSMARARKALDWKAQMDLAIDPDEFLRRLEGKLPEPGQGCTMCGPYCAMRSIDYH